MAKIIDIDDHGQPLEDIKFKLKINKDQAEGLPKDSSELSNNPGFAKLKHQLDINMVSKSQKITMML